MKKRVNVKPLSVNRAFQGRRFKTKEYKNYEAELLLILPRFKLPPAPYTLKFVFGFSNKLSDATNPIKLFEDILCTKYGFNDRDVNRVEVDKKITKKGKEFIEFEITTWQE